MIYAKDIIGKTCQTINFINFLIYQYVMIFIEYAWHIFISNDNNTSNAEIMPEREGLVF